MKSIFEQVPMQFFMTKITLSLQPKRHPAFTDNLTVSSLYATEIQQKKNKIKGDKRYGVNWPVAHTKYSHVGTICPELHVKINF